MNDGRCCRLLHLGSNLPQQPRSIEAEQNDRGKKEKKVRKKNWRVTLLESYT